MNIRNLLRRRTTPFDPQQSVRFEPMAYIGFKTRRDQWKFHNAGLAHLNKLGMNPPHEAKKHQLFKLIVNGKQMVGRIIEERQLVSVVGNSSTVMLVQCQPRHNKNNEVVCVNIRFDDH